MSCDCVEEDHAPDCPWYIDLPDSACTCGTRTPKKSGCEAKDNPSRLCTAPRNERWMEYDGRGIELCYVCDECRDGKLKRYRPEILRHYTQEDVDEPIEPDEGREYDWDGESY